MKNDNKFCQTFPSKEHLTSSKQVTQLLQISIDRIGQKLSTPLTNKVFDIIKMLPKGKTRKFCQKLFKYFFQNLWSVSVKCENHQSFGWNANNNFLFFKSPNITSSELKFRCYLKPPCYVNWWRLGREILPKLTDRHIANWFVSNEDLFKDDH